MCTPKSQTFLDEQDPSDIYDAAEKADSFALTHKLSNKQNDKSFHNKYRPSKQPAFPENTVQSEVIQGIQAVRHIKTEYKTSQVRYIL